MPVRIPEGQRSLRSGDVTIAYADTDPHGSGKPVLLLIHGSPVDIALFARLIPLLEKKFRVIAPVLPGFGASSRELPDYSIRAHALYLDRFLNQAGLPPVHVVGYSMGSGVAIELAHLNPRRLLSLTLLSGIGVQEHELLGNYHLNHLLHALQLAFFWSLDHFVPHFGLLKNFPLNYYYARNFFDTDQRPLKQYLSELRLPVLILHGDDDVLVPVAAARAHHALIRRSELSIFPRSGHLLVWEDVNAVAGSLTGFVERLEAGILPAMQPEEQRQTGVGSAAVKQVSGGALWFILVCLALATFASEDLAALSSGILAANGNITFLHAAMASFAGIFIGDILLMFCGRALGSVSFLSGIIRKNVSGDALLRAENWLRAKGIAAVFLSRFVPGTRLPLYLAIGYSRQSMLRFTLAFCAACLVWTPLIVAAGYFFGDQALEYLANYQVSAGWIFLSLLAVIFFIKKILIPLLTWRGRRLLYSSYLRLTLWEFWPPWIFYIPLGFYFIFLIIRHRSFTVFTAANPAIPDGGVIGESKAAILQGLSRARKNIARFALIEPAPAGERMRQMSDFMRRQKLKFPVVLKPDVGERGNDVQIVYSGADAASYFEEHAKAVIVQEYIAGLEFGVFYFRIPQSHRGEIFAITDKRFPALTGDGERSLEELILSDPRAVMMARFHLKKFATRLGEVVPAGEKFALVELGTHCKGSLFLDGTQHRTPELVKAIEGISQGFDGFFFGRYDIRVPSLADFRQGKNLKVVELNGVTSEATSIYDPKHSLTDAYKVLARQWQIAFSIGAENAARGAIVTPLSVLIRHLSVRR